MKQNVCYAKKVFIVCLLIPILPVAGLFVITPDFGQAAVGD